MPENIYPQLPTAPPISQESFNIEMVKKYYQDIANLKEKYTEKQRKYKNAYNRLQHASTGASTVALASGVSTIGKSVTIVGIPISASLAIVSTVSTCVGACLLLTSKKYLIAYIIREMDKKFNRIYYSNDGYWRGKSAIQKLAKASGSTKEEAEKWLLKQSLYQIYLPPPKYVPRPNASMSLYATPNDIHQADILYLPHDKLKKKTYKYALNVVDVASRYKGSYQLTTKNAKEVAQAFQWMYKNTELNFPKTLIVDDGKEFYSEVTKLMEKHDVIIQRGDPSQHRSQGIVERYNKTLADRLFSYQYHNELEDPSKSNREWVSRLQNVVSALNNEKTRLIGMKPVDAIKQTLVEQGFSQPIRDYEEGLLDVGTKVRYLYEPGELEGQIYRGERRKRSTDPIWSVDVYKIKDRYVQKHQPTLYYLDGGPKRSFVSEELQPIQDL